MKSSEMGWLPRVATVACMGSIVLMGGCGGGQGDATQSDASASNAGAPESGEVLAATGRADVQVDAPGAAPSTGLPAFGFTTHTLRDSDNVACPAAANNANATAVVGTTRFAQTHLLSPSQPFFHLSAGRPTWMQVAVTGSGASPVVSVQGVANGVDLGRICLSGPATLPAAVDANVPDAARSFTGTLPAAWMRFGLQLTVTAGNATRVFTAVDMRIGPSPELALVTSDWLLFGDTQATPVPPNMDAEFFSKLPVTRYKRSAFPLALSVPELPIPPRSDGLSKTGASIAQPAVLATEGDHCTAADRSAGTCTPWGGVHVLRGVQLLTGSLQNANGMDWLSTWYGVLGLKHKASGGLGGGPVAAGNDYSPIFNHELGHTFDMPHWGSFLSSRPPAGATKLFPYTGVYTDPGTRQTQGGGFGATWAFDPLSGAFVDPICPATGKERQDPMQRINPLCLTSGRLYDHYSDFSSLFIYRYFAGAGTPYAGQTFSPRDALGNAWPSFLFPATPGRTKIVYDGSSTTPRLVKWDEARGRDVEVTPAQVDADSRVYGERFPLQWDVPVFTLWGSFSNATPAATTIFSPLHYRGNLKRVWDPTSPVDFAAMKAFVHGQAFWWGADLVVKAEYSDGTVQHALVKASVRSTDPLSTGSFTDWAVNVPAPAGVTVTRVSLYHRPMEVRWTDSGNVQSPYATATNLNSSLNSGVNAANYLSGARLVASKTF